MLLTVTLQSVLLLGTVSSMNSSDLYNVCAPEISEHAEVDIGRARNITEHELKLCVLEFFESEDVPPHLPAGQFVGGRASKKLKKERGKSYLKKKAALDWAKFADFVRARVLNGDARKDYKDTNCKFYQYSNGFGRFFYRTFYATTFFGTVEAPEGTPLRKSISFLLGIQGIMSMLCIVLFQFFIFQDTTKFTDGMFGAFTTFKQSASSAVS